MNERKRGGRRDEERANNIGKQKEIRGDSEKEGERRKTEETERERGEIKQKQKNDAVIRRHSSSPMRDVRMFMRSRCIV